MFKSLGIYGRFAALTALVVIIAAGTAQLYFSKQEGRNLDLRLREKVQFINNFYAFLISDALQRKDDVTLLQVINRLEEDPEVTLVVVVDQTGEVRYHPDAQRMATAWDDALVKNALQTGDGVVTPFMNSGGKALALVSPLKVQGQSQPIGAVRIELTYRHLEEQIATSSARFYPVVLGLMTSCILLMGMGVRQWVLTPLFFLQRYVKSLNPMILEANLPETKDEFGEINKLLNDFILRMKGEWQRQQVDQAQRAENEKHMIDDLVRSFLPNARVIVADKENRIVTDTSPGRPAVSGHLLDLITDANFATLVNNAFQREGNVVRSPVTVEMKPCQASVLSLRGDQTVFIKTVIVLQAA